MDLKGFKTIIKSSVFSGLKKSGHRFSPYPHYWAKNKEADIQKRTHVRLYFLSIVVFKLKTELGLLSIQCRYEAFLRNERALRSSLNGSYQETNCLRFRGGAESGKFSKKNMMSAIIADSLSKKTCRIFLIS